MMEETTQSGQNYCDSAIFEDADDDTSLMVDTTLELGSKEDLPKFAHQEIDDEDLEDLRESLGLEILVKSVVLVGLFGLFFNLYILIMGLCKDLK